MDVRVADHQVETGDALKEHAIGRIEEITEKYYARSVGANVTFGRGPQNDFTCDIVAPVAKGVVLKSAHRAPTAQIAFDGAADKIERQLKRWYGQWQKSQTRELPAIDEVHVTVRMFGKSRLSVTVTSVTFAPALRRRPVLASWQRHLSGRESPMASVTDVKTTKRPSTAARR